MSTVIKPLIRARYIDKVSGDIYDTIKLVRVSVKGQWVDGGVNYKQTGIGGDTFVRLVDDFMDKFKIVGMVVKNE